MHSCPMVIRAGFQESKMVSFRGVDGEDLIQDDENLDEN